MTSNGVSGDLSQPQPDVLLGTAAQLTEYLFPEGGKRRPVTDRSAILGRLVVRRLEEAEVEQELRRSFEREQRPPREGVSSDRSPIGATPEQYVGLVRQLLDQCMHATVDDITTAVVPESRQLMRLGPALYPAYRMEAIGWAAAFGEAYLEQAQAV